MATSPMKLPAAAMRMAGVGRMARLPTTVAMALGASVAPFTTMTPMLSSVTTSKMGFCINSERKKVHSMVTEFLPTNGHAPKKRTT